MLSSSVQIHAWIPRSRDLWPCDRLRIRHPPWPYRHLRKCGRCQPAGRLRAYGDKREYNSDTEDQRLHHTLLVEHCANPFVGLLQRFGQYPAFPGGRHEICISHPARQHMHMDMSGNSRTCGATDVHAYVNAVW